MQEHLPPGCINKCGTNVGVTSVAGTSVAVAVTSVAVAEWQALKAPHCPRISILPGTGEVHAPKFGVQTHIHTPQVDCLVQLLDTLTFTFLRLQLPQPQQHAHPNSNPDLKLAGGLPGPAPGHPHHHLPTPAAAAAVAARSP